MGQVLHGCATTTHAVRAAIQRSKAPIAEIAERHGLNRKTVRKWRGRAFVHDAAMGDGAHLGRLLGLDLVGVVPEIEPVHVAMIQPEADVASRPER